MGDAGRRMRLATPIVKRIVEMGGWQAMAEATYDVSSALGSINANLHTISKSVDIANKGIDVVQDSVDQVDSNVKIVYSEVEKLSIEFHEFVQTQIRANRLGVANTKIVSIRQELDKRFGHYDTVRRHTTGILQATDLELIRSSTITTVTEELMLDAPNYWLAPCLVAIAAWIGDQPELAEKALREAIKRNDEKTSLLFALICRRADRKDAALKWTQRYLENQDEENLDRKAVIILDAFASGLLGADSEGIVAKQIDDWLEHLSQKPGFIEKQTEQWSDAMNMKRPSLPSTDYPYLRKYSKTWPILEDIMIGANLHAVIFDYFETVFNKEVSTESLKEQLDEILTSLVTQFDDEELPLRKEEKFEQFVIDFEGDESRAKSNMAIEQTAFETHKDFTQLLTDAAMKPESSGASVSTQKFAIALSRDWVTNAYNDNVAQNRMKVPHEIQINLDNFNDKTTDGQNERDIVERFSSLIDTERDEALAKVVMTGFEKFCLVGGIIIGAIGIFMLFSIIFLGLIAIVAGIGLVINYFSKKKQVEATRKNLWEQFEQKRQTGIQIIRATLAEVVDFRAEFREKDSESETVTDFLGQISPDQYVRRLSDSTRRLKL
jgi:Na+-transporting methylmalonyl-CoA/oxaloacetate decarboxylase gamma subunit